MGRYGLMPQNTGYIALGSDVRRAARAGDKWDGVSLTLFLDTRCASVCRSAGGEVGWLVAPVLEVDTAGFALREGV